MVRPSRTHVQDSTQTMTDERKNLKLTPEVFQTLNDHRNSKHMNWDGYLVNLYEEYTSHEDDE